MKSPAGVKFSMVDRPNRLHVLVVEDEALIRWSIAETLGNRGHTVVGVGTAASAVRAVTDAPEPVDVVLLDYRLPDSSDLGLLAAIRRLVPHSAVVLMTAYGTPEITKGALELGAARVVNKPFDMHHLEAMVLDAYAAQHPASESRPSH